MGQWVLQFPNSDAPLIQTYQLAAIAKMSKKPMNKKLSKLLAETRSVEKIIVRTSCPCVVPNPVLRTTARQPPSGVILEGVTWRTFVPENKAAPLCPPSRSRHSEGSFSSMDSLRRGVDSPESIASLTMQLPCARIRSAGIVVSCEPRAATKTNQKRLHSGR